MAVEESGDRRLKTISLFRIKAVRRIQSSRQGECSFLLGEYASRMIGGMMGHAVSPGSQLRGVMGIREESETRRPFMRSYNCPC